MTLAPSFDPMTRIVDLRASTTRRLLVLSQAGPMTGYLVSGDPPYPEAANPQLVDARLDTLSGAMIGLRRRRPDEGGGLVFFSQPAGQPLLMQHQEGEAFPDRARIRLLNSLFDDPGGLGSGIQAAIATPEGVGLGQGDAIGGGADIVFHPRGSAAAPISQALSLASGSSASVYADRGIACFTDPTTREPLAIVPLSGSGGGEVPIAGLVRAPLFSPVSPLTWTNPAQEVSEPGYVMDFLPHACSAWGDRAVVAGELQESWIVAGQSQRRHRMLLFGITPPMAEDTGAIGGRVQLLRTLGQALSGPQISMSPTGVRVAAPGPGSNPSAAVGGLWPGDRLLVSVSSFDAFGQTAPGDPHVGMLWPDGLYETRTLPPWSSQSGSSEVPHLAYAHVLGPSNPATPIVGGGGDRSGLPVLAALSGRDGTYVRAFLDAGGQWALSDESPWPGWGAASFSRWDRYVV